MIYPIYMGYILCYRAGMIPEGAEAVLARRDLDEIIRRWRRAPKGVPKDGWIRAVREALEMTAQDLARRMGVTQPAIAALEASEGKGSVQLDSLRRVAKALECDLVYAFVPRMPLQKILERRRRRIALEDLSTVGIAMDNMSYGALIDAYARKVKRKRVWKD